jgi:hypothetical protein
MTASKFMEAQIALALRQAEDGTPIAEVAGSRVSVTRHFTTGALSTRPHAVRDEARGRERQAEADRRRPVVGQGHVAGDQARPFDPSDRSSALRLASRLWPDE